MSIADLKDVVKDQYGQAALRVTSGGSSCCGATASRGCDDIRSRLTFTTHHRPDRFPKRLSSLPSAVEIPPRWRN